MVDPERGPIVKRMFEKVANDGYSGRDVKRWLDGIGFTSRQEKKVALSQIYLMLKNSFYTGRFRYPIKDGKWYQGKHKPLIDQDLFDRVQVQLTTHPKSKWGAKTIIYKGLFKCGTCKMNVIGEERFRKRKWAEPRRHVYYHCARQLNRCPEPYINERKLVEQVLKYINFMNIAHPNYLKLTEKLKTSIDSYMEVRKEILYEQNINPKRIPLDIVNFARHILHNGTVQEKRDLVLALGKQMYIRNKHITSSLDKTENII